MGKTNAMAFRFTQMRGTVRAFLLPTTCRVYRPLRVYDSSGGYTDTLGTALTYEGKISIPCRIDPTRYYRQAEIFGQEGIVSDFEVHVPVDFALHHDYQIEIDGEYYQVRKLFDAGDWNVTNSALVSRVGQGIQT